MSFDSLGLSKALLQALLDQGYSQPTPIQSQAIPQILAGRDVMASAQTGTGKTAGFTLPMLEILSSSEQSGKGRKVRALILTPTRELAAQIGENVIAYGRHLNIKSTTIFGGVSINPQTDRLRRGVDVLVATPGRLLDHVGQGHLDLSTVNYFVLDEADRMLDMGFIHDIKRVLKLLPPNNKRQNLLFSATFSKDITKLAGQLLNDPVMVDVAPKNSTADRIDQLVYPVDKNRKKDLLAKLIIDNNWGQVLVFTRTKHGANRLVQQLLKFDINGAAIHGNKSQGARTRALSDFKKNEIQVLVATDIAARGLDIALLPHVVNYELPNVPEDYVHRIGRTARAGHAGMAVSLVCGEERKLLQDIEKLLKRDIPKTIVEGFEPSAADANEPLIEKAYRGRGNGSRRGGGQGSGQGSGKSGGQGRGGQGGNSRTRNRGGGQSQGKGRGPGSSGGGNSGGGKKTPR